MGLSWDPHRVATHRVATRGEWSGRGVTFVTKVYHAPAAYTVCSGGMTRGELLALYERSLGLVLLGLSDLLDYASAVEDEYMFGCTSVAVQPVKFLYERVKASQALLDEEAGLASPGDEVRAA